ncbi:PE-PPE domain-containing protein [Mycolicibacter nonchromogenicus]|uniref:PE-PPE domain-containing protein n=1 Tax=Mycolicibacter nonchromogenicus TaxID=1782 RepID=A0A1X1Z531_MYCNO|nr:PE-PPE domain-containing protein [Mycolicibacter nonchromogenicus]ORW18436.1 PE-PPE domain-containing protein [Mycolicibacter nonchromogenicus]
MNPKKALAPLAAASMIAAGVAGTPVAHAAQALDVTLLSDTAIFVGGTMLPTPSATFAQTAADLFLQPLGFDPGDDAGVCLIGAGVCDDPLRVLTTPQLFLQGYSSFAGAAEIVRAVHAELTANPDAYDADNPLWIFGYSQGATAGSIAMAQLADDGVDPEALHFVFIGNPSSPDGVWANSTGEVSLDNDPSLLFGNLTPNNAFTTTVYSFPGDPVDDYTSTSILGTFWGHVMYLGLTPEQVADHTATADGLITNIDISGDIDQFSAWVTALGNGLIDSGWWVSMFNSIVEFVYAGFGRIEDFFTDWMGIDWGGVEDTLDYWFPLV